MSKPFAGVRILDFTRYLAGPYGTYQLALLGADVVKIESREGDETRSQLISSEWAARKMPPGFLAVNANKRSLTLDLRRPEAVAIVQRLVVQADVVWENFRPGVMDKLGVGYDALAALNPRLIYCAVSGFGHTGPERTTAAFDGKLQAMSGIMSITGEPAGGPMRAGFAICDTIGGMTAALAVASALYQRTHTGRGQFVDVAMLDAALAFIPGPVSEYTVAGIEQRQIGNGSVSRKPTANRFRAKGGFIVLAVLTDRQFASLMRTLGRPDALDDPRFKDWPARTANVAAQGLGGAADGGRRPLRQHLDDRRDRAAPAARAPRRPADGRLALRTDAARRRRLPPRPRQSGHRARAAHARRAHRRDPRRSRLHPGGDRAAAPRRRRLTPSIT